MARTSAEIGPLMREAISVMASAVFRPVLARRLGLVVTPSTNPQAAAFLESHADALDIWHIKGACEFDLGKFEDAKASFNKVLGLDPKNESAKKYLSLTEPKPGELVVSGTELPLSQADFESRLNFKLEGFTFQKAIKKPASIPEYFLADYTSGQNFDATVTSLEQKLTGPTLKPGISKAKDTAILVIGSESYRVVVTVSKKSPVQVNINYQKIK